MYDKLTRDSSGKRTDKTGKRDLTFNNWHRKHLGNRCYATDIDFYEYRIVNNNFIPKAFLEVKQLHVKHEDFIASANTRAIFELAQKANVRFFIILYKIEDEEQMLCGFWVWEIKSINDIDSYRKEEFQKFFKYYSNDEFKELLEKL